MAGRGGKRNGAGRPTIAKELASADLARKVLIDRFGSLETALNSFLDKDEPALDKFILEHAFGKSPDKVEMNADITSHSTYDLSKLSDKTIKELLNATTSE